MRVELSLAREPKMDCRTIGVKLSRDQTFRAVILRIVAMNLFHVFLETTSSIEPSLADSICGGIEDCTRVRCEAQMIGTLVTIERLALSEGLIAWRVVCASVQVLTFMRSDVSSQSSCREEALIAALPVAFVCSLVGVSTLDVLCKMLLFPVRFIAASVIAFERSFIGVRAHVRNQPRRAVECLVT